MRVLNRQYRGMDKTTDVLSFPLLGAEEQKRKSAEVSSKHLSFDTLELRTSDYGLPLGDIVINLHKAKRQAEEYGVTLNEELQRLLIHGLVHLMGYDHEKGRYHETKMKSKELELLNAIKV